jgi:putative transposase
MADTYTSCYVHYVFRPHHRRTILPKDLRTELFHFIGGIARNHGMVLLSAGGVDDHVHLLISLNPDISISKAIQIIKANSSRWVKQNFNTMQDFRWQKGYGGFTIGVSQIEHTSNYLDNQEKHHKKEDFKEEYLAFLKKHGIDFDESHNDDIQ